MTIPTPKETNTRRVTIARVKATKGGSSDKGDVAKSIKFMIFKNQFFIWLEIYCR
ncbi:hypothetical protein MED222_12293 [Vibrio sp. MED222]|nr:hypothetical protein MED222_12293 [Vibrio sp. MED222]